MDKVRQEILDLVGAIEPFDEVEEEHIRDAMGWIDSGVEIFRVERHAVPPKHLVCYTVLIDYEEQKILLLEHKKAGLLLPSGGHVDKGEELEDTVKREVREELGIRIIIVGNQGRPFFLSQSVTTGETAGHIDVDLWYLIEWDSNELFDNESDEFQREFGGWGWYTFDEILEMPIEELDTNMHRFVEKLKLSISNESSNRSHW